MLKRSAERCVNIRERGRSGAGAERSVNIRERSRSGAGAERSGAMCEYKGTEPERSDQLYHVFKTTSLQNSLAVRLKATNSRSDAAKRVGSNPRVLESQPKAIIYLF